jgi:hypothetical protein
MVVCELFNHGSVQCLIRLIPIKELFKHINMLFCKVDITNIKKLQDKYKIKKLPSLIFLKDNKLIGKIEGYYDVDHKKELQDKIQKILK